MDLVGVKIQARTGTFINATIPTREEIRKENYLRRRRQLESEGWNSRIDSPYVMLGGDAEPIIMRNEKGKQDKSQTQQDYQRDYSRSETAMTRFYNEQDFSKANKSITEVIPNRTKTTENMLEMTKTIRSEVRKIDMINQNVRSGQSFFSILEKEKKNKLAKLEELRQKQLSEPQKAEDDYDDDSNSDSEYKYLEASASVTLDNFSRATTACHSIKSRKSRSRPYTPTYNNISRLLSAGMAQSIDQPTNVQSRLSNNSRPMTAVTQSGRTEISLDAESTGVSCNLSIDSDCLFRQLSALKWILRCMIKDNIESVARISLSWSMKNDDNKLTSIKNQKEIKQAWDKFLNRSIGSARNKEPLKTIRTTASIKKEHDELMKSQIANQDEDEDVDKPNPYNPHKPPILKSSNIERVRPYSSISKRRQRMEQIKAIEADLIREERISRENKRLSSSLNRPRRSTTRIPSATTLRAEDRCSERSSNFVEQSRLRFEQSTEECLMELKENIKNMSNYKLLICQNKFQQFRSAESYHRIVSKLHKSSYQKFFSDMNAPKNKNMHAEWYLKLKDMTLCITSSQRTIELIEKLRKFALITISSKMTPNRLYNVLKHLANWELKHPDISAAIGFILDHIVPISDADYSDWLNRHLSSNYIQ